jgi:hypothetical protein
MPNVHIYRQTRLDAAAIAEFFPRNANYRDFEYFLFQYHAEAHDRYSLEVYAVNANGDVIKQVASTHGSATQPISYNTFIPSPVYITVEFQLSKLPVPPGQVIKSIELSPYKFRNNYAGFEVKIEISEALAVITKTLNPSPPATTSSNTW